MASNLDKHNTNKNQSPPEIQKHGPKNRNTRISTSKKDRSGAKKHLNVEDSYEESSSEGTDKSKEFSSTISLLQRRRKRRKCVKGSDPKDFKKSNPPTFYGNIMKEEEA
jgi:hypothetical protein